MVPLILDNKEEVGNVVWVEDIWEPQVEALFPYELKKLILKTHNQFQKHIEKLDTQERITHNFHYCATDLSTKINEDEREQIHIALSQNPLRPWNKITQAYLNLIRLKNKETLNKFVIHCRALTVSEKHVMSNMNKTSAALVDACTLFYHLGPRWPQIKIINSSTSHNGLIQDILLYLQVECGKKEELKNHQFLQSHQ